MNSGKSTALLQAAFNYEERGQHVLLAKPAIDTKADSHIESRLGVDRPVDFVIEPDADTYALFQHHRAAALQRNGADLSCLLIDEAQFLTDEQVNGLLRIALLEGIPVLAYG